MRFKNMYSNQQVLGQLFGVTSHDIGKWLIEAGLRNAVTKAPTSEAHNEGFCEQVVGGPSGQYTYHWQTERTVQRLVERGHALLLEPPLNQIEEPELKGPFAIHARDQRYLTNSDGEVVVKTISAEHAVIIWKLLTAADKSRMLEKLLA